MRRVLILVMVAFALSAAPPAWADQAVTIQDSPCTGTDAHCFAPAPLSVPSGTTVTWTNTTSVPHTVTHSGGTGTDNWTGSPGIIASKGTYSNTFTAPGSYTYYCQIHNYMHGTVTVTGGPPPPPDTPTASFTANPSNPTTGQAVTFDGSAPPDSDGDSSASYHWTFGDGATAATSGPTTTHSYATAGTVTVTLDVIDSRGSSSPAACCTAPVSSL